MSFFATIFAAISAAFSGLFGGHGATNSEALMPVTPPAQERPMAPETTPTEAQVSAGASSDTDLSADLGTIDSQIKASASDSTAIDASLSDTPVAQTE